MSKKTAALSLVLGLAVLLGILGAGAAFAADPPATPTSYHEILMGKVAKILGIDQQKLSAAFDQAHSEMLDDAVAEGRITQERADWMKQRIQQGTPRPGPRGIDGPGPKGPDGFGRKGGRLGGPRPPAPAPTPNR